MKRIALDLNNSEDRKKAGATDWRWALGFVPGQPNQGLVAEIEGSPARLADYDDSTWELCDNVGTFLSKGLTVAWYRTTIVLPKTVDGQAVDGALVTFETNIDDY